MISVYLMRLTGAGYMRGAWDFDELPPVVTIYTPAGPRYFAGRDIEDALHRASSALCDPPRVEEVDP